MLFVLTGMPQGAEAQWPLGKDVTQLAEKAAAQPNITITGRFQIFVSPHIKGSTFMIDTDTGKIWIILKDHSSGDFLLKRVPVEEVDGKDFEKRSESKTGNAEKPQEKK
ncbi:MAG: hypothetical protein LDL33_03460 [Desulfomonile sp.]|nr:hypothetical protein [Desulfomonile sp.]